MSRIAGTILVAAACGCFSVNRDPVMDYDHVRTPPPSQVRAQPSTWYRGDWSLPAAAAAPAPSSPPAGNLQARSSAYQAGPSRPAPRPAPGMDTPADGAAAPAAVRGEDIIDQNLAQATMTVAPRLRTESGPRIEPPAPIRDPAPPPLPRSLNGKSPEGAPPAPPPAPVSAPLTAAPAATPATTLRLISSRRISFSYEFKDPNIGDGSGVELWGTRDLKTWKKFDTVAHGPHAVVADLKDEGMYGFTLLAHTAGSPARDHPQPGDLPQVWVVVDYTKPAVQFLGAELNLTARTPTVILRWSAQDRNFGPHPITLSYAEHAEGPWKPIAGNLENTGRYEWVLPATVPATLHVRVQAVDLMGNAGSGQTTSPLHLPRSLLTSATPVALPEKPDRPAEPERPVLPPRQVVLPPAPALDLPRPPAVETPRPQVSITSVEVDRN